jgi:ABC-type multidrug transport system ATPase subunit
MLVGLEHHLQVQIKTLSQGYKRKLSVLLALIGSPRLLILDEPTSNLDLNSREKVWGTLRQLVQNQELKISILVSTQHIEEAERLSSRIFIIQNGEKAVCDTT